mmetsp:Transcript_96459/g.287860  ORF Transcript_96459/g.287860 Transcript_96459/m.287860 type:complete len:310 (-) Transcript_96459:1227-2156(-)
MVLGILLRHELAPLPGLLGRGEGPQRACHLLHLVAGPLLGAAEVCRQGDCSHAGGGLRAGLDQYAGQPPLWAHLRGGEAGVVAGKCGAECQFRGAPSATCRGELDVEERGLAHLHQAPSAGVEPGQEPGLTQPPPGALPHVRIGDEGVREEVALVPEKRLALAKKHLRERAPCQQLLPRPAARRCCRRRRVGPDAVRLQQRSDHLREDQQRTHERSVRRHAGLLLVLRSLAVAGAPVQRRRHCGHRDVVQGRKVRRPAGGELARQRHGVRKVGQDEVEGGQRPRPARHVLRQQPQIEPLQQSVLARGQA